MDKKQSEETSPSNPVSGHRGSLRPRGNKMVHFDFCPTKFIGGVARRGIYIGDDIRV